MGQISKESEKPKEESKDRPYSSHLERNLAANPWQANLFFPITPRDTPARGLTSLPVTPRGHCQGDSPPPLAPEGRWLLALPCSPPCCAQPVAAPVGTAQSVSLSHCRLPPHCPAEQFQLHFNIYTVNRYYLTHFLLLNV